jgi:hypothetical protein
MTASISYSFPAAFTPPFYSSASVARTAPAAVDTVTLSPAAQLQSLSAQGKSPSEIASTLGLSVKQVDSDLGLDVAAVASAR